MAGSGQVLPPEEPVLDVDEIQGNALPGFMKANMIMLALRIRDPSAAREWLTDTVRQVTSLATVMESRRLVRAARSLTPQGDQVGAVPDGVADVWVNLAFSHAGLTKLAKGRKRLTAELADFEDDAFRLGLAARSALLGDPSDPEAEGHPSNWVVGRPREEADVLVIIAADDGDEAQVVLNEFRGEANVRGLKVLHEERGAKFDEIGKEHFGFQDGISQPGVRGRMSEVGDDFLGHREIDPTLTPDAWLYDLPGQLLVWPGEFVFGYPGASADPLVAGPVKQPGPWWSRNGSYVVYRRLRQDVAGFWRFLSEEAERLSAEPGFPDWTPERLGAALVGRWPSGAPLARAPDKDDCELGKNRLANNVFGFATDAATLRLKDGRTTNGQWPGAKADPVGLTCPLAAHIRKVNSREAPNDLGASRAGLDRRILRRGIPYGQPLADPSRPDPENGERGLLFVSYQSSISDQFEFLNTHWMGSPVNPRSPSGFDMVVGQNGHPGQGRERHCMVFGQDLAVGKVSTSADFVIPTGGGYFFSPSITAMRETLAGN